MSGDSLPSPLPRSSFTIRPANSGDIQGLLALESLCFTADRLTREEFLELLDPAKTVLLVAMGPGATMVAYATVMLHQHSSTAQLVSIAVHPGWQGHGLGRWLLSVAEDEARSHGRLVLGLDVREDNAHAIRTYLAAGYRQRGRALDYYDDHSASLQMVKALGTAGQH